MSRMFFNDPFRTCGKISEFDKIPGYWGVRTFQAGHGYPLSAQRYLSIDAVPK